MLSAEPREKRFPSSEELLPQTALETGRTATGTTYMKLAAKDG